jgi:hypothetical protein
MCTRCDGVDEEKIKFERGRDSDETTNRQEKDFADRGRSQIQVSDIQKIN